MTKPTIALTEMIEKGADADLLKQMIRFVAQRMLSQRSDDHTAGRRDAAAERRAVPASWRRLKQSALTHKPSYRPRSTERQTQGPEHDELHHFLGQDRRSNRSLPANHGDWHVEILASPMASTSLVYPGFRRVSTR